MRNTIHIPTPVAMALIVILFIGLLALVANQERILNHKPKTPRSARSGDPINHPTHYQPRPGLGFECIELTRQYGFLAGNIIKYVWRWQSKNGIEDLRKALWYATRVGSDRWELTPIGGTTADATRKLEALCRTTVGTNEWFVWDSLRNRNPANLRAAISNLIRVKENTR